jgi:microcystin degradation protein MlrC
MRVGIVSIQHESITFMPEPTVLRNFEVDTLLRGEDVRRVYENSFHEVGGFFTGLKEAGHEAVPLLTALAVASGTISADTLDTLLKMLDEELDKAGKLDALLVAPHGAGVSAKHLDMDAYWVERLRKRFGPKLPIVVTLDPHANVSQRLIDAADAVISYRTNPHLDQHETGLKAARLLARMLKGEVRPTQALAVPRLQMSIDRQETAAAPCRPLYALAEEIMRRPGVLSASIALGFPYADVPQVGTTMWVVTNNDLALARKCVDEMASYLITHRVEFKHGLVDPETAVRDAKASTDRVCLLDVGDNAGGGGPADGTILPQLLHDHAVERSLVLLYDPESTAASRKAGVGAKVTLRIGAKSFPGMGRPLELPVTVKSLHEGKFHDPIPSHGGRTDYDMGPAVVVETDRGMTILLFSLRIPPYSLQQILSIGLDPQRFRVFLAKGVNAPLGAYRPVVDRFVRCNTPGPTCADMTQLPFHHRPKPLYPFEEIA